MIHTQEEIINALQVIQDTCREMKGSRPCEQCPLGKNGDCVVQEQSPEDWDISTKPPTIWKAFN